MKNKEQKKVLFVSSEVYPFAKSGGLADVSFGLPKAMSNMFDLSVIMPLYRSVDKERFGIEHTSVSFEVVFGKKRYDVDLYETTYEGLKCYFVESNIISGKKYYYGTPESGYKDNDLRFGLFCRAVTSFIKQSQDYELVHLNDWQSAMCALFIKEEAIDIKSVFTIHNLAYQGVFSKKTLQRLGLSNDYFNMDELEFYGDVSFIKAGIAYADSVTTVSQNYAKEILTSEFGCGLDGFLQKHKSKLTGILNGVDLSHFNPKTDPALLQNYDAACYDKKRVNKYAYLKERGLDNQEYPLIIFIGRFTWQKGVDVFAEALKELGKLKLNIAILGDGEAKYHNKIKRLSSKHRNIDVCFGYDEELSHRMYSAADFLVMPSHFEPCGLNQMISMSYGVVPIVNSVGGLKDSVHPFEEYDSSQRYGYGIRFDSKQKNALVKSVKRALKLYKDEELFKEINRHNMSCDFSWDDSAKSYASLYTSLMEKVL